MFDLSNVEKSQGFELLPPGKYPVVIESAELKTSNNGNQYVQAKFKVAEGKYSNRVIFHNFNTANKNPKAVQVGLGQLKQLAEINGRDTSKIDINGIHGLKAYAAVRVKSEPEYGDKNVISYFDSKGEEKPAAPVIPSDLPF